MTEPMSSVLNAYNNKYPIKPVLSGCRGNCSGFIEAGGLAASCSSTTTATQYLVDINTFNRPESAFSVSFDLDDSDELDRPPPIVARIAYSENSSAESCEAIRTERTCYLASATIRYLVMISQGAVNLDAHSSNSGVVSLQPRDVGNNDVVDTAGNRHRWTLGGLYLAANMMFKSNATYTWGDGTWGSIQLPDSMSSQFLKLNSPTQGPIAGVGKLENLTSPTSCGANWTDPTGFILDSLNKMAFMLSVSAANFEYRNTSTAPPVRTWPMKETRLVNVYKVDYSYLFASISITLGLVVLIMPTFIGWWDLGRSVSFNPVEIAKAFDAPLLSGPGSNAPLKELVSAAGKQPIKYGDLSGIEEKSDGWRVVKRQLVFRAADEVTTPKNGFVYE